MLTSFTLARFILDLRFGDGRQGLPAYLGSTFRGVFASTYRRLVCATGKPDCRSCLLQSNCSYPYIFETSPPSDTAAPFRARFLTAPRPYVLQIPLTYRGEEDLKIGLVLVGRASEFLPYFLYALQSVGERGLGPERVPYQLCTVRDGGQENGPVVFEAGEQRLQGKFAKVSLDQLAWPSDAGVIEVTLEFVTPLRLKKYGKYGVAERRIEFFQLFDLLLSRLEALAFFHGNAPWMRNEQLRQAAHDVHVVANNLEFYSLVRYSNRQQQKLPLHGYVGTITVAGAVGPFLPLLRLGEYLHLGAGTAFGLGRYRLHVAANDEKR